MLQQILDKLNLILAEKQQMTKTLNECGVSCEESTSLCEFAELYEEALSHQVDPTLTVEGSAADAKATGDRLNFLEDGINDTYSEFATLRDEDYAPFKDNTNLNFDDIYNQLDEHAQFIDNNAIDIVNLKEDVENLKNNSGGSGTGGVSSWNDLTDKPFYSESKWITGLENVSMTSTLITMAGVTAYGYNHVVSEEIYNAFYVEGRQGKFIVDGNEYTCTCKYLEANGLAGNVYGNTDAMLGTGNTGEPFIMIPSWQSANEQTTYFFMIIFIGDTQSTDHTCSMSVLEETIKKLDSIYLDENYIKGIVDEVISEALEGDY